ncbi:uncharacterized protein LOC121367376 isoform X2 [Gigantopelta aegis]|nr:uncharacterized protein LOC121367376 isoform X2 [Gigantopelta aegis]XP_041347450.1 uncharacterized protein LOC121367376 isoform X2 [Gigantopelta aegis]
MRRRHKDERHRPRERGAREDSSYQPNDVSSSGHKRRRQHTGDGHVFPRFSPWVVCLVTIVIRVNYVINPENWWILHPDEIFQSLEVAHSEVFGYGFRAYEYLPGTLDARDSGVREGELNLGMSSMRSFLYPRFYILVSWLADVCRLQVSPFLLWKVAHTCITSLLPLAVYSFAVVFYKKKNPAHDIGVIAAILVASNVHLSVFGTHTLVNSFLATPVFWALSVIWEILEPPGQDPDEAYESPTRDTGSESKMKKGITTAPLSNNTMPILQNGHAVSADVSHENITDESTPNKLFVFLSSGISLQLINKCFSMTTKVASRRTRSSQMMHKSGFKTTAVSDQIEVRNPGRLLVASFVLIICYYVRIDVAVVSFVTIVTHVTKLSSRSVPSLCVCVCGSVLALFLAIVEDSFSYKFLVVSPYNWLQFNVFKDLSSAVFGRMDCSKYLSDIFVDGTVSTSISCVMLLMFLFNLIRTMQPLSDDLKVCWVNTLKLFVSLVILLALYSTKGHKEMRFMHNFLVLLCLFYSAIFVIFIKLVIEMSSRQAFAFGLSLYILGQWFQFPSPDGATNTFLTFESSRDSQHIIQCMDYLRQQRDVTGVFIDGHIHTSGGYSALHKDVPIISLVHYEFFEFDKDAARSTPSIALFHTKNITVKTFSETSNFITMHNTPLLLRELILNKHYNYLILGVNRQFIQVGYHEVYRSGIVRILKRLRDPAQENQLNEIAKTIPIGSNATILEYEGSWLVRFKRYQKAAERLASSVNLDFTRVGAFQLLAHCFFKMGQEAEAKKIMLKCAELNGKQKCTTPKERIILHEDYILK